MTLAAVQPAHRLGRAEPRIAPPRPARSLIVEYRETAKELGITLLPSQDIAAQYLTALGPNDDWLYREVCDVEARRNGKTMKLLPLILMRMRAGRRILHTAQNRDIPRQTFLELIHLIGGFDEVDEIRKANGQESVILAGGGRYSLVAPNAGARGRGADDVLLDEVREQRDYELMAAIANTLAASANPQLVFLSNAGDSGSVVLNDLRRRGMEGDQDLAYLEWSASPERAIDDRDGWAEANPALGITIREDTLAGYYRSLPTAAFETENLCRWVTSMQPQLVSEAAWLSSRATVEAIRRPSMAIGMDSRHASAVIAWAQADGSIGLRVVADVTGDPIDVDRLGPDLKSLASKLGCRAPSFDPWTDADLARHLPGAKPLTGREFANASENFVRVVESGRLRWDEADAVTRDLVWTARKPHESGAWQAVKADDEHSITAALAAVRAVWMASAPRIAGNARIR